VAGKMPPTALRELARRRLDQRANASPEEWAKAVEKARKQGFRLVRFPGVAVRIRDYSLNPEE
jgi:DNA-binding IclR family transcriptional regulator